MYSRRVVTIALFGILALVLAACSSDSKSAPTATGAAASATPARTSAATSVATGTASAATTTTAGATPAASGMRITSSAFADGATIPVIYTCSGAMTSPPLAWTGVPSGTAAFALTVDDPDAAAGAGFDHWVIFNLSPDTTQLPAGADLPPQTVQGKNGAGTQGYLGPCPPPGSTPHHYRFHLYALDTPLNLPPGTGKTDLLAATAGHVLGDALLVGLFSR